MILVIELSTCNYSSNKFGDVQWEMKKSIYQLMTQLKVDKIL